jgi:peptide/nickel transport system permease protein
MRRIARAALLAWLVVSLCFLLLELAPGDASVHFLGPDLPPDLAEAMRLRWGLDRPIGLRYLLLLRNLLSGDLGTSLLTGRPALALLAEALPATLSLTAPALALAFGLGVPLGAWQALRAGSRVESAVSLAGLTLVAMPGFWLGLLLIIAFASAWPLFPTGGASAWQLAGMGGLAVVLDRLHHLALPLVTVTLPATAWVAHHQRASLLGVLGSDYVRTARAMGLSRWRILWRHALPNGLMPVITLAGVSLPFLLAGSVLVETVFSWPGTGRLLVRAVQGRDSPVIIACFLVYALLVALGGLLADLAAGWADVRVREGMVPDA